MKKYIALMTLLCAGMTMAEESRFQIRVGVVERMNMKMKMSGGIHADEAMRYQAVWSQLNPASGGTVTEGCTPTQAVLPAPADDTLGVGDRTFDDGFVNQSPPTSVTPNSDTWYWSYDSKTAQYAGSQITYHRTTIESTSGSYVQYDQQNYSTLNGPGAGVSSLDANDNFGAPGLLLDFVFSAYKQDEGKGGIDLVAGISGSYVEQDVSDSISSTYQEDQYNTHTDLTSGYDWAITRTYTETYAYNDLYGVMPAQPETYSGTLAGPGPVISDKPTSRTVSSSDATITTPHSAGAYTRQTGTRNWTAVSDVNMDADIGRVTLNAGPELSWQFAKNLQVQFTPVLTLNYFDISATRKETLSVISPEGNRTDAMTWQDKSDAQQWLAGASIKLGLSYALSENWGLCLAIAREWVFGDVAMNVGPGKLSYDFDSYNLEGSLMWDF